MTPRERLICALSGGIPDIVPHLELEFQLCEEVFGQEPLRAHHLEGVSRERKKDLLKRNAELWVRVAQEFDYSVITGLHWLPLDEQMESFEYVREIAGDTFMLSAFVDGTYAIPSGSDMVEQAVWFIEREEEALEKAERMVEHAIEVGLQLIKAGAEIIFMCADYCFNSGPFLSPRMFRKFVTPFLKRQIDAFRQAGAWTVKHTDGNIMPILDQLIECRPDAIHSLDPQAGVDIKHVRQIVGTEICLMGNVKCAAVHAGTKDEIKQSALYCLLYGGVSTGAYVYCTSNCIFKGVPVENYRYMLELRKRYGSPEALEELEREWEKCGAETVANAAGGGMNARKLGFNEDRS